MAEEFVFTVNPGALAALGEAAELFVSHVGDDLLNRQQHTVPKETWALHDSLKKETGVEGTRAFADVGVDETFTAANGRHPADYVDFVEHGTSSMAAEPFLLPALMQTIGNLASVPGVKG